MSNFVNGHIVGQSGDPQTNPDGSLREDWQYDEHVETGAMNAIGKQVNASVASLENIANQNIIINGNFDIWQRGTTQTTSGYRSDDRWYNHNSGSTKTHSRQEFAVGQTDVPGNPMYFSRTVVNSITGTSNSCLKQQRIENVRSSSNKVLTLSFWAKADSNKNISIEFTQNFGTTGTPSPPKYGIGVTKMALTTMWKKYVVTVSIPSVAGKVITLNDHLCVNFWFDAGSNHNARTDNLGHQSGTFDIASVATPFVPRSYAEELALCQRYYVSALLTSRVVAYSPSTLYFPVPIPVQLRTMPTITNGPLGVYSIGIVEQTGFTSSIHAMRSGGVMIRADKNNHGLTDGYIEFIYSAINAGLDAEL